MLLQRDDGVLHPVGGFVRWRASISTLIGMSDHLQAPGPECNTTIKPEGKGEHVLVVDDDPSIVETGKQWMEQWGYRVTACTSSVTALALIHATSEELHCVISDLVMPGIGGFDLANTCRLCRPATPFLLMSENASTLTEESLRMYGISEFVRKPFSPARLADALNRALATRKN